MPVLAGGASYPPPQAPTASAKGWGDHEYGDDRGQSEQRADGDKARARAYYIGIRTIGNRYMAQVGRCPRSHGQGGAMAELTADLFVSLDGFARGENAGPFFGYGGPDLSAWVDAAVREPQLLLMGRVTYEVMSAISASATDEASVRMNNQAKAVFSNTIAEPLAWSNTRLIRGDLGTGLGALKRESAVPIRTIGSIALVNGLMRLGLVDRLRILVFPLTLGSDGSEPIYSGYPRTGFELIRSEVLDSRVVALEYRPA